MIPQILLSEETSQLLRKVAEIDNLEPDFLVKMWCLAALPIDTKTFDTAAALLDDLKST